MEGSINSRIESAIRSQCPSLWDRLENVDYIDSEYRMVDKFSLGGMGDDNESD